MVGRRQTNNLIKKEKEKNKLALLCASSSSERNEEDLEDQISNFEQFEHGETVWKENCLREQLKEWVLKYHPTTESTRALLKILNDKHSEIPLSVVALVGKYQPVVIRTVAPGTYFHIGIKYNLSKIAEQIKSEGINEIVLDIGIDGLPLYKSSETGLWPILGRIVNMPMVKVFLIGSYVGEKKPLNIDLYLHDLIYELQLLKEDGFSYADFKINIKIRAFVCDTPARSYICGIRGHNSLNGCSKCDQKGVSISRVTTFSTTSGNLRTDDDFQHRRDKNFHQQKFLNAKTPLETVDIKMISQFPLDVMHLIDLGVVKRMIVFILKSKTNETLSSANKQAMSSLLASMYPYIPREFSRKARTFDEIAKWKAVEFREFVLYTGLVVLKKFRSDAHFNHYLHLSCAYRLLISCNNSNDKIYKAHEMMVEFVKNFSSFYGECGVTHNVHNLLHLKDVALQFDNLSNVTAYPFENAMKGIKESVRKAQFSEQQLFNIFSKVSLIKDDEFRGIKLNSNRKIVSYTSELGYFAINSKDNYCLINGKIPVAITKFINNESFKAKVFIEPRDMFIDPVRSKDLGIFVVNLDLYREEIFKINQITSKIVSLPYECEQLLIAFAHSF